MKKTVSILAITGVWALGIGVAPAMATGNCDYYTSCSTTTNGVLSVSLNRSPTPAWNYRNIYVQYKKDSGSQITAQFGRSYNGGKIAWAGKFVQSAGTTKGTTWGNAYYEPGCYAAVGYMSVVGQQLFNTPPVTAC